MRFMNSRNLVLTGFMGTGKTSVGRLVAERLRREFVDMDELIAVREGMSIADIFARHGESHFRALERGVCAELAARNDLVIATGGGTLVDPGNCLQFRNAVVICLDADVEEIARRLEGVEDRPLLNAQARGTEDEGRRAGGEGREAGGEEKKANSKFLIPNFELRITNSESSHGRRERILELLAARQVAYAQIPMHVNTSGRGIEEVAREVMDRFAGAAVSDIEARDGSYGS